MDEHEDLEHAAMVDENRSRITSISPERARFPCCIVWTPLPVLSWFIPFIGHLGICREDGVILDFAGPNFVCVDNFTFGSPTRYIQLKKEQCDNLQDSSFNGNEDDEYEHTEPRTNTLTWDEALHKSTQEYQHHSYNLLTCNCHSFVGNVLNRLRFQGRRWNVINLAAFVFLNGRWVSKSSFLKSFVPFLVVFGLGVLFGGGTFLVYLLFLVFVLVCWFFVGTYCFKIVYV